MHDLHRIPKELFWGRRLKRKASIDLDAMPIQKAKIETAVDNWALYVESCTVLDT